MLRAWASLLLSMLAQVAFGVGAPNDDLQLALGSVASVQANNASPVSAQLWQLDSQGRKTHEQPLPPELTTPLGSLWKLFIFDYLVTQQVEENPYTCRGQHRDEVYCCDPGQSITRDEALVKSCGLYFAPERLGITEKLWGAYWSVERAPAWLRSLDQLQADTQVSVQQLLQALAILPAQADARRILLDRNLAENILNTSSATSGTAPLATYLGSRLRIKTWSWHRPAQPTLRIGGFAGWLTDGTPVWASASGTSQQILQRFAPALEKSLPTTVSIDPQPCVEVALFDRYQIKSIANKDGVALSKPGVLAGRYKVNFKNGNSLDIESQNDIFLLPQPTSGARNSQSTDLKLVARLSREEYIARILDREAASTPPEAAKALAIVARTYLQQNAARSGECLQINDSSHHQRVSPRPATQASRAIAEWTTDLILAGSPVTYHQTDSAPSKFSWTQAQVQAAQGWRFDAMLAAVFPRSNLARWDNPAVHCQALPAAEQWLQQQLPRWRKQLDQQPGYQETHQFSVCRLQAGNPHIDRQRRQIYARRLQTLQDRLDLTHEYLHLAFDAHPAGQDEIFIETLTRRLLLE